MFCWWLMKSDCDVGGCCCIAYVRTYTRAGPTYDVIEFGGAEKASGILHLAERIKQWHLDMST